MIFSQRKMPKTRLMPLSLQMIGLMTLPTFATTILYTPINVDIIPYRDSLNIHHIPDVGKMMNVFA
jgi:hypothetical protein